MCTSADVLEAGLGLHDTWDGHENLSPEGIVPTTRSREEAATRISKGVLTVAGEEQSCAFIDMTNFADLVMPGKFSLCSATSGYGGYLLAKTGGEWKVMDDAGAHGYYGLRLTSFKHGSDWGYSSELKTFFFTSRKWYQFANQADLSKLCSMKELGSSERKWRTAHVIVVEDPLVTITMEQGALLQFFDLLVSLGGYISISTVVFGVIFVKQYPKSDVVSTMEARTLVGCEEKGNPPGRAARSATLETRTQNAAENGTMRHMQQHRQQLPEFPPGIVPASVGSRQTE